MLRVFRFKVANGIAPVPAPFDGATLVERRVVVDDPAPELCIMRTRRRGEREVHNTSGALETQSVCLLKQLVRTFCVHFYIEICLKESYYES